MSESDKPKEFWLNVKGCTDEDPKVWWALLATDPGSQGGLHLVEYSAFETARARIAQLEAALSQGKQLADADSKRIRALESRLAKIKACVDEQAEDEGLWSLPWEGLQPVAEAHLQQELRRLHNVVEEG